MHTQAWKTVEPVVSQALLTNPGIGFMAAPQLMVGTAQVPDSRGLAVDAYRFAPDARTANHPDSQVCFCGVRWKDLELQGGRWDWTALEQKLDHALRMGCTAVVRVSPYALADDEDIPAWLRARYPQEPEFPFWRIDPNQTAYPALWARMIRAFGQRYDGDPRISSVDMAIVGAWGEGGGTEFLHPQAMQGIIAAYFDAFKQTPLQALLHDPASLSCIRSHRTPVGFRVDCLGDMGGFHGEQWSHMLDFYPQNIQNFGMGEAWRRAPVVFEACWHMNDWYLQGWDIDYIIEESLKWHISSYNSKGTAVPGAWREPVERWVRRMGYRFELRRFAYTAAAQPGQTLQVRALLANVGVAPCYHPYPPVLRLLDGRGNCVRLPLDADIRRWLPDQDIWLEQSLELPKDLPAGEYELQFGVDTPLEAIGPLRLAIEGRNSEGYYPMGSITITQGGEA